MSHICEENKQKINEIQEIFHLKPSFDNLNEDHKIEKRQILTAIMVGVVTSLVSSFSTHELYALSQHDNSEDTLESNQDHIVQCLQDHETRLSREEHHVRNLENQLKKLNEVTVGIIKQSAVFAEASTSTTLARILSEYIDRIPRGLYQLNVNKLDPSLITYTAAKKVMENITKIAAKKGYTLGINAPIDLFQVESNFLANGQDIFIFTSVPIVKNDDVIDLYRYQSAPLQLNNSSSHLIIKPEKDIIAVANDRSTFETFSLAQLNSCKRLHDTFYCTGR